jgi:hypothetical protein
MSKRHHYSCIWEQHEFFRTGKGVTLLALLSGPNEFPEDPNLSANWCTDSQQQQATPPPSCLQNFTGTQVRRLPVQQTALTSLTRQNDFHSL